MQTVQFFLVVVLIHLVVGVKDEIQSDDELLFVHIVSSL